MFKKTKILLSLILILCLSSSFVYAADINESDIIQSDSYTIEQNGNTYNFTILDDAKGNVTRGMLEDIASRSPNSANFTVYNVGDCSNQESNSEQLLQSEQNNSENSLNAIPNYRISVNKLYIGEESLKKTSMVMSVAKGEKRTFSTSATFLLEASVNGGATYGDISIKGSTSVSYTSTYEFVGPPEDAKQVNTRLYFLDFYGKTGTYTRVCLDMNTTPYPTQIWRQEGDFLEPTKYISYSRDEWHGPK